MLAIYCHACSSQGTGRRNSDNEIECSRCGSFFVEESGQIGLTAFYDVSNSTDVTSTDGGNQLTSSSVSNTSQNHDSSDFVRIPVGGDGVSAFPDAVPAASGELRTSVTSTSSLGLTSNNIDSATRSAPSIVERIMNLSLPEAQSRRDRLDRGNFNGPTRVMMSALGGTRRAGGSPQEILLAAMMESLLGTWNNADMSDILHHILVNEQSVPGAPPASDDAISKLERIDVDTANAAELGMCYITQEPFEIGSQAIRLPCKHAFQPESLERWLKIHNTCPNCRMPVTVSNGGETEAGTTPSTSAAAGQGSRVSTDTDEPLWVTGRTGDTGTRVPSSSARAENWFRDLMFHQDSELNVPELDRISGSDIDFEENDEEDFDAESQASYYSEDSSHASESECGDSNDEDVPDLVPIHAGIIDEDIPDLVSIHTDVTVMREAVPLAPAAAATLNHLDTPLA